MAISRVIIGMLIAASLLSLVAAIPGTATYYTAPYVPSSCYGYENRGTLIAAANRNLFANRAACGRRLRVRCTGSTNSIPACRNNGEVTVTIVDLCPGCGPDQLDLSLEAFSVIANPDAGRIRIDYTQV